MNNNYKARDYIQAFIDEIKKNNSIVGKCDQFSCVILAEVLAHNRKFNEVDDIIALISNESLIIFLLERIFEFIRISSHIEMYFDLLNLYCKHIQRLTNEYKKYDLLWKISLLSFDKVDNASKEKFKYTYLGLFKEQKLVNSWLFIKTATSLWHVKDEKNKAKIYSEIIELSNRIFKALDKSIALNKFAKFLYEANEEEFARKSFKKVLNIADDLFSHNQITSNYKSSKIYFKKGLVLKAINNFAKPSKEHDWDIRRSNRDNSFREEFENECEKGKLIMHSTDYYNELLNSHNLYYGKITHKIAKYRVSLFIYGNSISEHIRNSLSYYPYDYGLAVNGTISLLAYYIRLNHRGQVRKIIEMNPELKLGFLIDKDSSEKTYTNYLQWLTSIEDIEIQNEIKFLAKRVERGKMTEEDFNEEVKELLE